MTSVDIEGVVIRQVAAVLELDGDEFSLSDNFFDIGGDSLSAIVVADRLAVDLEREVSFELLFDAPCLEEFCRLLTQEA